MQYIRDNLIWLIAIPVLIGALALTKYYWPEYPDDCPAEEALEQVIQAETGLAVDLTPGSRESSISAANIPQSETQAK